MNITDQLAQALERLIAVCNYEDIRPHVAGHIALGKEALEAYRASKEGEGYRPLVHGVDKIQKGDEYLHHHWRPYGAYGAMFTDGIHWPSRRPIRPMRALQDGDIIQDGDEYRRDDEWREYAPTCFGFIYNSSRHLDSRRPLKNEKHEH